MKLALTTLLIGAAAASQQQAANLRANSRQLEETLTGTYVMADVQYQDGRDAELDGIELADGTILDLECEDDLPPGLCKQQLRDAGFDASASGLAAITVTGTKQGNGKFKTKGKPSHAGGSDKRRRKLAIVEGDRTVLAVMVTTAGDNKSYTQTRAKLEDDVFLDGVSLKTQYLACSHNKLNFVKATDRSGSGAGISNGIVEITVPNSSTETDSAVRPAVTSALNSAFGVSSPTSLANHVMYCLPPGTMSGIAYAYINSWNSVYSDVWCNYVSAQLHEIGHNLNLAHSNEGTQTYGDQSGMMGYSYSQDDGPVMCFNNAKNFQLGWFDDATVVVDENSPPYVGPLKGQVNYTPGGDPVVIKINDVTSPTDYYVGLNHKVKHNSGTVEGGNQVTIQRAGEGNSYVASVLVAKLSAGQSYSVILNNKEFTVTVNSIDIASDTGKAMVTISSGCTDAASCDDGIFCNGVETCVSGTCVSGTPVSCPDDGLFCNGSETCSESAQGCVSSGSPCSAGTCEDAVCTEETDTCSTVPKAVCCGDGICAGAGLGEDCTSCVADCPSFTSGGTVCGNNICEDGETCTSCPADCNGVTGGKPSSRYCCSGSTCADGRCTGNGNTCDSTPNPVLSSCCGDGVCSSSPFESFELCNQADCNPPAPTPVPVPTTPAPVAPTAAPVTPAPVAPTPCLGKNGSCSANGDCCSGNCKNNGRCA